MSGPSLGFLASAAAIAVIHTVLGPDHWLPFTMLSRARGWSRAKTLAVTFWGGIGHVSSALALAVAGLATGYRVSHVVRLELLRADVGAWSLIAFGLAYASWGVRRAVVRRHGLVPHEHDGHVHVHHHGHLRHAHTPHEAGRVRATTFWTVFAVLVLGPCEPLIPLFVIPVTGGDVWLAGWTALVFAAATVATMLVLVGFAAAGFERLRLGRLERWSHALAGGVIATCGAVVLLAS